MEQYEARTFIGGATTFDVIGASTFATLVREGLREHHQLLDIGCGCLRVGKLLLTYLRPGHYSGVEPREDVLSAGIEHETGPSLIDERNACILIRDNYDFTEFDKLFDAVLAASILSHTYEDDMRRCLTAVEQVLSHDGVMHATFIETGSQAAARNMSPPGMDGIGWSPNGVAYTVEEFTAIAESCGFGVSLIEPMTFMAGGMDQLWAVLRPIA